MDLRGHWSSVCPALLRYPRRNQVAPEFSAADELSHRWRPHPSPLPQAGEGSLLIRERGSASSLRRAFSGLYHHQLVFPRLVPAAERRGLLVLQRVEAGDALLEAR